MTNTATIKKGTLLVAMAIGLAGCDALQITGGPLDFGAAQSGNLLNQGNFDGGFGDWRACSDPAGVVLKTNDDNSESSAQLAAGGCIFQTVPASANDDMVVSCSARKNTNEWGSLTFGYLDANHQPLGSVESQIAGINFSDVTASLRAPTNTAFAEVMIYMQDGGELDDCELINKQAGLPEQLLVNAYFEEDLNGWTSCDTGTASVDNNVATINEGCLRQTFVCLLYTSPSPRD